MNRSEELAEKILLQLLTQDAPSDGPHADVAMAFALADAFLAACEPEQKPECEPDAVWEVHGHKDHIHVAYSAYSGMQVAPNDMVCTHRAFSGLLAGRERVRLRVFVEEVEA